MLQIHSFSHSSQTWHLTLNAHTVLFNLPKKEVVRTWIGRTKMRCNKSKASVCLFTNLLFPFQSVTLLFPSCPSFSCHLISLLAGVLRNSLPELLTPLNFPLCLSAAGCLSSRPTFLPPTVFFLEGLKTRHSGMLESNQERQALSPRVFTSDRHRVSVCPSSHRWPCGIFSARFLFSSCYTWKFRPN